MLEVIKMRIDRVQLDNIRSYNSSQVQFGDGLILIEGDNGAGKSSLLSTIFSGLYLSDVLKYMNSDINLDSLVKKSENEGKIKLQFSVNGDSYNVEWVISVSENEDGERKGSTKKCTLTGSNMDDPLEGVRDVSSKISDILGMNSRSFVNSVYVQQGDIMSMVEASEDERKEIIDDLLGLKKLDDFAERMDIARREFGSQKRTIDNLMDEKNRQLNEYDDLSEIQSDITKLNKELSEKNNNKEDLNEKISDLQHSIDKIQTQVDNYSSKKSELDSLVDDKNKKEKKVEELKQKEKSSKEDLNEVENEIQSIKTDIQEKCKNIGLETDNIDENIDNTRSERDDIKDKITDIEKGKISNKKSELDRLKSDINDLTSEVDNLKDMKSDNKENLNNLRSQKQDIDDELNRLKKDKQEYESSIDNLCEKIEIEFENLNELTNTKIPEAREDLIDRVAQINKDLGYEIAKEEIYTELVEDKYCPVCENENVTDSYNNEFDSKTIRNKANAIRDQNEHLDRIYENVETVKDLKSDIKIKQKEKSNISQNIDNKKQSIEQAEENIEQKRDKIGVKNEKIAEIRDQIDELQIKVSDLKDQKEDYDKKLDDLVSVKSDIEDKEQLKNKKKKLENDTDKHSELKKEAQKQLFDIKQDINEIQSDIQNKNIDKLKNEIEDMEDDLQDKKDQKDEIEDDIMDLQGEIAEKKQEKNHLENLKEEYNRLKSQKVEASERESDSEELMDSYRRVKTTLRKENIGLLNKYANEVFNSVYSNKVYKELKIDEEYNIRLVTGSDIEIEPKNLSGGEKTILSLSIRAGIYKLLVERNSNSDTLPPFILDEPTTYLDDNHVSNIQTVIDKITSWNVPQVFVVSHNYDVIQNADESYTIEKKPTTESSMIKQN